MRKMKDSRVAWLGEIPENWKVVPPKALFRLRKEKAAPGARQLTASQQHGIIYQDDYMALTGSRVVTVEKDFSILKRVEKGDFVISMRSFQGGLEYSENAGSISSAYVMLIPNLEYIVPEFYKWLFKSPTYITALQCTSNLIRDGQALRYNNFVQVPLCIIPKDDQKKIASTLGEKCQQIDDLISNVQAQIEKLKAYKQSLITEVVTKGLDPNVPMRDSGVEWIGKIPKHYDVIRMRYLINNYKAGPFGSALITDQLQSDGDILCYTPEHIANQSTESNKNLYLPENRRKEMSQFFVSVGDIIFPIVGSLGRAMVITSDMPAGIINQRLAKFSIDAKKMDINYFMWLFAKSSFFHPFIDLFQRGSIIVNLTKAIIYDMPMIVPPTLEEQKIIASYLVTKCAEIDQLIAVKHSKIEKLEQYKRSLIYEYVTGKKEIC